MFFHISSLSNILFYRRTQIPKILLFREVLRSLKGDKMKNLLEVRVAEEAKYILKYRGTVRAVAKIFGVSKSTVHHDLAYKLSEISPSLYRRVDALLKFNLKMRCIRGGEATRRKYRGKNRLK